MRAAVKISQLVIVDMNPIREYLGGPIREYLRGL